MRQTAVVAVIVLVVVGSCAVWMNGQIESFTQRCHEAGGKTRQYGTAMSSWVCLSPDGRILVDIRMGS